MRRRWRLSGALLVGLRAPAGNAQTPLQEINLGRQALAARHFAEAERYFRQALTSHEADVNARMGLADTELGLHRYEEAELDYRRVVAAQPQMWVAHKNLVIVEAALRRWEEFDRERELLRAARARGAEGISARESDVIDGFTAVGRRWIVREYFEPVGRSQTRYNFETFGSDGRAAEYISLESEAASRAMMGQNQGVAVGESRPQTLPGDRQALNWYTGKAHGVVRVYPAGPSGQEPKYEQVRTDVLRWLQEQRRQAAR